MVRRLGDCKGPISVRGSASYRECRFSGVGPPESREWSLGTSQVANLLCPGLEMRRISEPEVHVGRFEPNIPLL
jgi:hypothetical protein